MTGRWLTAAVAAGFLAGHMSAGAPSRHWSLQDGTEWAGLAPAARMAYADGFLAGAGFAQALRATCGAGCTTLDSAGLRDTIAALYRGGRFRFPYAANVYVTRVNDYYWWENHRPLPLWYGFWEVNASLIGSTTDTAR